MLSKSLNSLSQLTETVALQDKSFILFYKDGSTQSMCAYTNFENASKKHEKQEMFTVDVAKVGDIHPQFGLESVPAVLIFEKGEYKNLIKGCYDSSYYENLFSEQTTGITTKTGQVKKQPKVVVYSTPTCSWCTRIKEYLKANNITYRDVDVSKDENAAAEMVRRSGKQGVPQTLIGSKIIVGFDKVQIDNLLGLN